MKSQENKDQSKLKGCFGGIFVIVAISVIFYKGCIESDDLEITKPKPYVPLTEVPPRDFYHVKHLLDSEFAYDVELKGIVVETRKNAFQMTTGKFEKPKSVDGKTIAISFSITNPYSKEMRIPFPSGFQLYAGEGIGGHINRHCDCHTFYEDRITDSKGLSLEEFSVATTPGFAGRSVDFNPNETKTFLVKFDQPFLKDTVTFIGFNKHLRKELDYSKLSYEDQRKYLYENNTEYGFVIDVASKKIVALKEY